MRVLPFVFALVLAIMPLAVGAQSSGFFGTGNPIVPEECQCRNQPHPDGGTITTAPDFGCVLQVAQNILNALYYFAILVTVLYIVYVGFQYLAAAFSGNNPGSLSAAKTRIVNVVVGLIVILASWLIVDFVMKTLYDDAEFGPWNRILAGEQVNRCIVAKDATGIISGTFDIILGNPVDLGDGPLANDGSGGTVGGQAGQSGINVDAAANYARSNARQGSVGKCALYVRKALGIGGGSQVFKSGQGDAYQFGAPLKRAGFREVYTGKYSASSENLGGIKKGDVVVFQRTRNHPYGHVAIFDGQWWVSDYVQRTMASNKAGYQGTSFTIYRP